MTRKRYSDRELTEAWEEAKGKCWRCGEPITAPNGKTALYGPHWHMGHVGVAHWLGGEVAKPEHVKCNMDDAKQQTKAAAKSVRIRAKAYGIKRTRHIVPGSKASPWKKKLDGTVVRRDGR